jgi:hypothetical protein
MTGACVTKEDDSPVKRQTLSAGPGLPRVQPFAVRRNVFGHLKPYRNDRLYVLPVKCYRTRSSLLIEFNETCGDRGTHMNQDEWQQEAESVISCAETENVRLALLGRIADRYAARDGVLRIGPSKIIDYKTAPLNELGVRFEDGQILAAFRHLEDLKERASKEQFSWTRQYLEQRLKVFYRGSRSQIALLDGLIRGTVIRRRLAGHVASMRLSFASNSPR